uniref:Uncharacterized protein n=1 Tax=Oryza meridionalis TaxID=40149 RepID=A0A0E0E1I6_9ORYZ
MVMSSISGRRPAACMSWRRCPASFGSDVGDAVVRDDANSTRRMTVSLMAPVGDAVVRDDANSTRRMTVSLMAPSFLARRHANTTDSRSSGPPRKTAAIWVPTFWSPWFLAAVVSSLVDILVGSWKLAPPLQNGRSVKMPTVHEASSSTVPCG